MTEPEALTSLSLLLNFDDELPGRARPEPAA
jgi:hypothetical protein